MSSEALERRFAAVGARLNVAAGPWRGEPRIDIRRDARGEYFDVGFAGGGQVVELEVVDVHPRDRHLLLLARVGGQKSKFLCGHDERHWFVAAVPEAARGVSGVATAMVALQPSGPSSSVSGRRIRFGGGMLHMCVRASGSSCSPWESTRRTLWCCATSRSRAGSARRT